MGAEPSGCPPITKYAFDFGEHKVAGAPGTADCPAAYAPRRTVLDKILVDAAVAAGVEMREGYTVQHVEPGAIVGPGGLESARVVVIACLPICTTEERSANHGRIND